jgi:hypothetical protein
MKNGEKMAEKVSIDYDEENDSIFLFKRGNVKGSIDIGDFIVDLDEKKLDDSIHKLREKPI